ncbi:MAG: hypothetical protein ING59_14625 [Burkholderiales bacterium]|nr:hypothetical protein [Burkholderiales bacterium]
MKPFEIEFLPPGRRSPWLGLGALVACAWAFAAATDFYLEQRALALAAQQPAPAPQIVASPANAERGRQRAEALRAQHRAASYPWHEVLLALEAAAAPDVRVTRFTHAQKEAVSQLVLEAAEFSLIDAAVGRLRATSSDSIVSSIEATVHEQGPSYQGRPPGSAGEAVTV